MEEQLRAKEFSKEPLL